MRVDGPPKIAERSISCSSVAEPQTALIHMIKPSLLMDQCPVKPSRRGWNEDYVAVGESKNILLEDADSITYEGLTGDDDDDESSCDGSCHVSDITDPTAFNNSMSHQFSMDDSWRMDSMDSISMRIDALGPLEEEQNDAESGEHPRPRLNFRDRAIFETKGKDTPPQLATRRPRSPSWSERSEDVAECRFGEIAPGDLQNEPTKPPSFSQRLSTQAPSALPKLAEVFRSGCVTGTHTYRLKKYPNVFVGSEAVDFMLSAKLASTREDAVFLGQRFFKELNLFHHVCWDHTFKDGLFFYRFNDESATPISKEDLVHIAEKFVEGMPVSKHMKSRFKTFEDTFLGDEAVNYMLQSSLATSRSDAVFLGQRMMEELEIFEPVAHNSRFKDTCYLYRFVSENIEALADEQNTNNNISQEFVPQAPVRPSRSGPRKENSRITFGLVQVRCFERCLDINPATGTGPSLGLGWRFYDDSPVSLGDEDDYEGSDHRWQLSRKERKAILKAWGYTKAEITRAARANQTIRKQRKRSLNK